MRILQINNQHYLKGGAHKVYFDTADLLRSFGHEVFFYSLKDNQSLPDRNDAFFPEANYFRELSLTGKALSVKDFIDNKKSAQKLRKYLDFIKPDVAHVHLFMGGLTTAILKVLKSKNIPIVHTVHDYRLICPSYLFLDGENKICERCKSGFFINCISNKCSDKSYVQSGVLALDAYYRKYVKKPDNYINKYIFVSKFISDKHIEFDASFKHKSTILHNFMPKLELIKPNLERGKYFVYLGRLSREKGVETMINAATKANVKLKVIGNGPLFKGASKEETNIEFLGYKNGDELWNIVKKACFVIVPSEWYENNPLSIIESYSYGKPVIGANIGGIPEILQHNETGFLFEQGNEKELENILMQVEKLSDDEYHKMSLNARRFAENNFSPKLHYERLIKIYTEIINNN